MAAVLLMAACTPENKQTETPPVYDSWLSLGPDELAGWEENGSSSWNKEILEIPAGNNWLSSSATYNDFQWEMEVNASAGGALGFRLADDNSHYWVNLDFDSASIHPSGTILEVARAKVLQNHQPDQWHKLRVEAKGSYLQVFLNDTLVSAAHDKRSLSGSIALKAGSETMRVRNQKIMLWQQKEQTPLLEDRFREVTTRQWQIFFEDGLKGWDPTGDAQWDLQDGVLHGICGEQSSWLVSQASYHNFYFSTQFKIIKEDNSGIFIRKHPDSLGVTLQDAIECNIYDHNGPQQAYSTGSMVFQARSWYEMIDYEDWNNMEIFAEDDHMVIYVNGVKASEAYVEKAFNKPGQIALQAGTRVFTDNGPSDVYFKDMKIKSMD